MCYLKYLTIIVICCTLLFVKTNASEDKKININLGKEETAITFILNKYINALYIQELKNKSLIILDYKHDEKLLEDILKENGIYKLDELYTTTPVLINLLDIESKPIEVKNDLIKLNYNGNNFCISFEEHQNNIDLKQCRFLYTIKFKSDILNNLIGNPEVIFQNENNPLPIKTQELIYDSWTELYTVNSYEYIILKISKDSFNTMIISK